MRGVYISDHAALEGRWLTTGAGRRARPAGRLRWRQVGRGGFPRFGRLDPLSRWALAAVELLGLERPLPDGERCGLVLASRVGSLGADLSFQAGLDAGEPSPAAFTYTLPSQAAGEIAVRYGIRGPISCLLGEDGGWLALYEALTLVGEGALEAVIAVGCEALDEEVNTARAARVSSRAEGLARAVREEAGPGVPPAERGEPWSALVGFLAGPEKNLTLPAPSVLACGANWRFEKSSGNVG